MKQKLTDILKTGKILIGDGAWGTFIYEKGLKAGECPEKWNLDRPDDIIDIAQKYVDAGSDMVETNSFGGSRFKLTSYQLENLTYEINKAAARLSAEANGEHWVLGSVGPTGKMLIMGDVTEEDLYEAFKEQAMALYEGGADAICVETMTAIDEAALAIRAAKENTDAEVVCTFTFDKTVQGDYKTMMGISPEEAVQAALDAGADIIGSNCGNGIERMVEIVREIRKPFPSVPILVQANAGMPVNVDGVDVFPETPEQMSGFINTLIASGANIIGGCCGTKPEHIKAIKKVVDQYNTTQNL